MKTVRVGLDQRAYPIWVGSGILRRVGPLCKREGLGRRVAIITSGRAAKFYLKELKRTLVRSGFHVSLVRVPDGERAKTLAVAERVWRALVRDGLDRSSTLIAFGGGTVGDLTGFVASTFLRGIALVHVPTTLLAAIDSAIGGKTGINIPEGKNLVGTFYQPRLVISDVALFRTLSARQFSVGLAEAVKYGVIRDAELFSYIEKNISSLRNASTRHLIRLVGWCSRIKADVVTRDERESNLRAILNYGHTIGHALEASSRYDLTHGEAISIGMMGAGRLALIKGWIGKAVLERQKRLLQAAGLPVRLKRTPVARILRHLQFDKKKKDGRLRFVLPRRIGRVVLTDDISIDVLKHVLRRLQSNE